MRKRALIWVTFLLSVVIIAGCSRSASAPTPTTNSDAPGRTNGERVTSAITGAFAPLPEEATPTDYQLAEELITLGRMLYYEPRLSINGKISCNSCHALDTYGVDGLPTSVGHDGRSGDRNAPTVYNAALHIAQFWDGRAEDVEAQAQGPMTNAIEMGMPDGAYIEKTLRSIPAYQSLFAAAFPDDPAPITYANAAQAIGAFERRLLTPSRFDRFLQGDTTQLNAQEQRGLATFVSTGCVSCHAGVGLGGDLYRKLGLVQPYPTNDPGRFKVTGDERDQYVFKVPSLRNIIKTGPYLHDGSIESLDEMVRLMARHQLGKELTETDVADIIAFMDSLTGEIPTAYIAPPQLPPNGPKTSSAP
jgi:cytochrome c peroxidase